MTAFSDSVRLLIDQISQLYEQSALLLRTADAILADHNWKANGNTAITGSNSLEAPTQWLARAIHRFYTPKDERMQHLLPFVAVLLSDQDRAERVATPLLCAGFFDYQSGTAIKQFEYWYARIFVWMENATDDGQLASADNTLFSRTKVPWKHVSVLATPLEQITTRESLNHAIQPILEAIRSEI